MMHTLRLSYQNANKRQKILLRRDLIFAVVLSPTIKIFHRHLGPNLYIFTVKVRVSVIITGKDDK
jgi:hypothetical protein